MPLILAGEEGAFTLSVTCDTCPTAHEACDGADGRRLVRGLADEGWLVDLMSGVVRCPACSPVQPALSLDPRHWGQL